jgi:hypothetical protein
MLDEIARELHSEGLPDDLDGESVEDLHSDPDFLNDDTDADVELLTDDGDSAGPQ